MTYDTYSQKLSFHMEGFFKSIAVMFAICTVAFVAITTWDHGYERFSPVSSWYEYDADNPVMPVSDQINYNENMNFRSNSIQHKQMDMKYDDTPECQYKNGSYVRLLTQEWLTSATVRYETQIPWPYVKQPFNKNYSRCRMTGIVTGTTRLGYKKIFSYESPWWKINNNERH